MQRAIYAVPVASIWAADFQTRSTNQIEKTASVNTNLELSYSNHDNIEASLRYVYGKAERQTRDAQLQQGTPAWLWVDEDGIPGKDPAEGYRVTFDCRGRPARSCFDDDRPGPELLARY